MSINKRMIAALKPGVRLKGSTGRNYTIIASPGTTSIWVRGVSGNAYPFSLSGIERILVGRELIGKKGRDSKGKLITIGPIIGFSDDCTPRYEATRLADYYMFEMSTKGVKRCIKRVEDAKRAEKAAKYKTFVDHATYADLKPTLDRFSEHLIGSQNFGINLSECTLTINGETFSGEGWLDIAKPTYKYANLDEMVKDKGEVLFRKDNVGTTKDLTDLPPHARKEAEELLNKLGENFGSPDEFSLTYNSNWFGFKFQGLKRDTGWSEISNILNYSAEGDIHFKHNHLIGKYLHGEEITDVKVNHLGVVIITPTTYYPICDHEKHVTESVIGKWVKFNPINDELPIYGKVMSYSGASYTLETQHQDHNDGFVGYPIHLCEILDYVPRMPKKDDFVVVRGDYVKVVTIDEGAVGATYPDNNRGVATNEWTWPSDYEPRPID